MADSRLAILGGEPAIPPDVHFMTWPATDAQDEALVLESLRQDKHAYGPHVHLLEQEFAAWNGNAYCMATNSGTSALHMCVAACGVQAGDEVITTALSWTSSASAIIHHSAVPVFVDVDWASMHLDPAGIEAAISPRTRAILVVHYWGVCCDMDPIMEIARRHGLAVIEDACQAWLAEYQGRKCGTLGDLGTFSFQESKHLPSGEGGAITSMSEELIDKCDSYHNCGRAVGTNQGTGCFTRGVNYRMTQAQAVLLQLQFDKLVQETEVRRANADYLSANLGKIPGITPVRLPANSRPVWHLYSFRYDASRFNGLSRDQFARAMGAEGVPCGGVYREQYYEGLLDEAIASRGFKRLWSPERLKAYRDSFPELKGNKQVCETTVSFVQSMLLADRRAMDDILEAIRKIQAHSAALAKA